MKVKLRTTDRKFTELVRIHFNFTCQRCGKMYIVGVHNLQNLGVSHYWPRTYESVRFDMDNVTLLCNLPCHRLWEGQDRQEYTEYMIKRLGQEAFELLKIRANLYCKRDDAGVMIWLKFKLKKVKNERIELPEMG